MSEDLLRFPLCQGCVPNYWNGGNNPQVELMLLCRVSVACSAIFLAVNWLFHISQEQRVINNHDNLKVLLLVFLLVSNTWLVGSIWWFWGFCFLVFLRSEGSKIVENYLLYYLLSFEVSSELSCIRILLSLDANLKTPNLGQTFFFFNWGLTRGVYGTGLSF